MYASKRSHTLFTSLMSITSTGVCILRRGSDISAQGTPLLEIEDGETGEPLYTCANMKVSIPNDKTGFKEAWINISDLEASKLDVFIAYGIQRQGKAKPRLLGIKGTYFDYFAF